MVDITYTDHSSRNSIGQKANAFKIVLLPREDAVLKENDVWIPKKSEPNKIRKFRLKSSKVESEVSCQLFKSTRISLFSFYMSGPGSSKAG